VPDPPRVDLSIHFHERIAGHPPAACRPSPGLTAPPALKVLIAEDDAVSRHRLQAISSQVGLFGRRRRRWSRSDAHARRTRPAAAGGARSHDAARRRPRRLPRDPRRGVEPYVYVILSTSQGEQRDMLDGFDAGADDYIIKPFEVEELRARLQTGARIVTLQEQLIAAREQLRFLAMHDSLTRVLNRVAFFEMFEHEVARARRRSTRSRSSWRMSITFKQINDQFGHLGGDQAAREIARRMSSTLRASDAMAATAARNLVIVARIATRTHAMMLADRFRTAVSAQPIEVGRRVVTVTLSLGAAATRDNGPVGSDCCARLTKRCTGEQDGRNRIAAGTFE
jgi:diguanylate cyclase (GGDEF)-like protein